MSINISNKTLKKDFLDISEELKDISELLGDADSEVSDDDEVEAPRTPRTPKRFKAPFTESELDKIEQLRKLIVLLGGYAPIFVLDAFEISNGLRGFPQDTVFKLLSIVRHERSFRAIIGICERHYDWIHEKIHEKIFRDLRMRIGRLFNPLQPISPKISLNTATTTAFFERDSVHHSLILNPEISKGIYKLTVKINRIDSNFAFLGVASAQSLSSLHNQWVGGAQGGACYYSDAEYVVVYTKSVRTPFIDKATYRIKNGDVISAEVDQNTRTVTFFRHDKLLPYYVVNIPDRVHFAYSGCRIGGVAISFQSLHVLPSPTVATTSADFKAEAVQWIG